MKLHEFLTRYDWYYFLTSRFTFMEILIVIAIVLFIIGELF